MKKNSWSVNVDMTQQIQTRHVAMTAVLTGIAKSQFGLYFGIRALSIECTQDCPTGPHCKNKRWIN